MFGQVGPTEFDLRFNFVDIPVRVTPWFWLAGLLLGWSAVSAQRYDLLFIWLGCLFFSILVHELGHAFAARHYGWPPTVILYHFGGLAMFQPGYGYTPRRSILISFAGPGAGFILYGAVVVVESLLIANSVYPPRGEPGREAIEQLKYINLYWGLVNLLPVLPLDGGRISEELCQQIWGRRGQDLAIKIAIVVAGLVAAYFFMIDRQYPGILFAILCVQNVQMLQQPRGGPW